MSSVKFFDEKIAEGDQEVIENYLNYLKTQVKSRLMDEVAVNLLRLYVWSKQPFFITSKQVIAEYRRFLKRHKFNEKMIENLENRIEEELMKYCKQYEDRYIVTIKFLCRLFVVCSRDEARIVFPDYHRRAYHYRKLYFEVVAGKTRRRRR